MPESTTQRERHTPLILTETATLSREKWLEYRRHGIGGSDVASLMGISPFRTARDLYFDKLNIAAVETDDSNWVALEMGHLLEDLVAKIFQHKTGFEIYQIKKMFYHPVYTFMLADLDYIVNLPNGSKAIIEIKTTNYNARDKWWKDGKEVVPDYYETQGRHYMAVMDIDQVFFCCLYGKTEDEVIIREVKRDLDYEDEMIFLEQEFWENHVQAKIPPPYTENGNLILKSTKRYGSKVGSSSDEIMMNSNMTNILMRYLELQREKEQSDKHSKKLEADLQRLKAMLVAELGQSSTAVCEMNGHCYTVTYNPIRKTTIGKDNLLRLKLQFPDVYEQFVTVSESRRFQVKVRDVDAA